MTDALNLTLVRVPAGEFLMGSAVQADEKPEHSVYLDEYWIGKYPVTVAQFAAFVRAANYLCEFQDNLSKPHHPATRVSWHDANAFCEWAGQAIERPLHLPSEAQWEKAARGWDGRFYPWGNAHPNPSLCNFKDNVGGTTFVGAYSPRGTSPYGCSDMAGNVYEWVADLYGRDYYTHSPDHNPTGPADGAYRVMRGGCWQDDMYDVRASYRYFEAPEYRYSFVGFRCASGSPSQQV